MVVVWPLAGLLHDYELVRLYDKREHPFWFCLKILAYIYFCAIVAVSWWMEDIQVTKVGNYSLIIVPIYMMGYTYYIFSNKFGRLFNSTRWANENAVGNEVDSEDVHGDNLIPEDAIF